MKRLLTTAILMLLTSMAQAGEDSVKTAASPAAPSNAELLKLGQQTASAVCIACHGLDGMSAVATNPNIAGMPAQYIAKQLQLFKSGERKNATMLGMVASLSPDQMKGLGLYYFAQKAKPNAVARDKALAEAGQKIYRSGIAAAKVPACAGCHGAAGAGIPAQYPRLAGQWPEYTLDALKGFASGDRKNPQMHAIASRMQEKDMKAAAEYIAGMRAR